MKHSSKYVSNLDLKYLGSKFITIPDNHLEVSHHLASIRKSRGGDISSIVKTQLEDTTLHSSNLNPSTRIHTSEDMADMYRIRQKGKGRRSEHQIKSLQYSQNEMKEIQKYRSIINRIKIDNKVLQKEITTLYRQKKINDNQPKTKPIKKIYKAGEVHEQGRKILMGPQSRQFNQVYQRLTGQDNPYRSQSLQLQKKLSASNMHKHFDVFLQSKNKRVPQFIKNMRQK